jgi:hypothetical protein
MVVNQALDPTAHNAVVQEAGQILHEFGYGHTAGQWQAGDWAIATLGWMGDLNQTELVHWFRRQHDALTAYEGRRIASPPYCWWLLMIAFKRAASWQT